MASSNNSGFTVKDIDRYHAGKMSAKERHAIEKAALDDPFLADALEGYTLTPTASADLASIRSRLNERLNNNKVVPFYRQYKWLSVAAIVLILAGAGWLAVSISGKKNDSYAVAPREPETQNQAGLSAPNAADTTKSSSSLNYQNGTVSRRPPTISEPNTNNGSKARIKTHEPSARTKETVVVGYGTQRQSDVTGSLSRITAEQMQERPTQNVLQALQGKAAGVKVSSNFKPGELPVVRVRGNRSLGASNDPLYVVDGIPIVNSPGVTSFSVGDINPNDIASMEILKDASATAIYGSRAANGVVLITTKKGHQGTAPITEVASVLASDNAAEPQVVTNSAISRGTKDNLTRNATSLAVGGNNPPQAYSKTAPPVSNMEVTTPALIGRSQGVIPIDTMKNRTVVMHPLPQDSPDLSKVVVGASEAKKKSFANVYHPHVKIDTLEPEEGYKSFDEYVASNLNLPEEYKTKAAAGEVQLSFDVDDSGQPINITVVKSLCQKCDEEAVRVLKEGPKWKKKKDKKGKVTITF